MNAEWMRSLDDRIRELDGKIADVREDAFVEIDALKAWKTFVLGGATGIGLILGFILGQIDHIKTFFTLFPKP